VRLIIDKGYEALYICEKVSNKTFMSTTAVNGHKMKDCARLWRCQKILRLLFYHLKFVVCNVSVVAQYIVDVNLS